MSINKIEVIALKDNDICLKWDKVFMKKGVFLEYHQENFKIVWEKTNKTDPKETKKVEKKKDESIGSGIKKMFWFWTKKNNK